MAAALSRALKLPGKKGSELGEYDPLTQADSDDESEEDDLVLNYPRNGLGRDTCLGTVPSKLRGSRSGRIVGAKDETQEDEEEEEEDEWREQLPSKSRQDRGDMKGMQYWSHRESSRDRMGGDRGAGSLGGAGLGVHSTDLELKRLRMKNMIRSAFFLVPVVCATLLVLLCAFLIPCKKGELERKPQWERALGDEGGVTPPALALWDVDGDSVEDVLLGVTEWTNDSHPTQRNKLFSVVVLSAVSGLVLWRKPMAESVMFIQCGLQYSSQRPAVCLLISKSLLVAVNGTTGKNLSSVQLKSIESQAVLLPDVQGDAVPDLLIATLPAEQQKALDLSLSLISGLTGEQIGRPVPFHLNAQGKLTGPLLHQTEKGAYYILFGLGNVEAISLRDIYTRATGKTPRTPALKVKDSVWEKLKNTSTSFVHIYRGSEGVEFLLPFVAGFGNNHNNLDPVSNLNTTRSDWVLVYSSNSSSSKLSVIKQKDIHKTWTFSSELIHSQPSLGHFNDDGVLDLFFQHSANNVMEAQVVDGATGQPLWAAQFVCPHLFVETSAISTTTGQSVFLFWASDPIRAQKNGTKTTVAPGVAAAQPLIRNLFLLHPAYPTILLELSSTTDTAVTSAVSYQEHQKDATYITVSSRPTTDSESGARIVKSMSLRSAIAKGQIVRLGESNKSGGPVKPGVFEVNRFFRRLTFRHQVPRGGTARGTPARPKAAGRSALQRH